MNNIELKSCPFCGGEAIINTIEPHTHIVAAFMENYKGGTFIECAKCAAAISGETEQEAVGLWNMRYNNPRAAELAEADKDGRVMIFPYRIGSGEFFETCDAVYENRFVALPCKLGDVIFTIVPAENKTTGTFLYRGKHWIINEVVVENIMLELQENGEIAFVINGYLEMTQAFLTRAEAEATLKCGDAT